MSDLGGILQAAAAGRFPPPDGDVDVLPRATDRADAVLGFTAHFVVAAEIDPGWVRARLPKGDYTAPLGARFLGQLGDELGRDPGSLDVVLTAMPVRGQTILELEALDGLEHARVARAARYRDDLRVYRTPDGSGVLVLGRGLAGRWEAAFEVEPEARGRGLGRKLAGAALALVPDDDPVFMQCAPGNAASLRAILAAGFALIGSEVLLPA